MNGMVYRGEIYYVLPEGNEVGCEQRSGRPGIVVSNNLNNKHAATVEVVYLTTKEKKPLVTHVFIGSSQLPSTAICEQITTVDKTRLNDYCGKLTQGEMEAVEVAIMASLGLDNYLSKPQPVPVVAAAPLPLLSRQHLQSPLRGGTRTRTPNLSRSVCSVTPTKSCAWS